MKVSLPQVWCVAALPVAALVVALLAVRSAGGPFPLALGAGAVVAVLLGVLGVEWAEAFRSRNPSASRRDEWRFVLAVAGVYLASVALAECALQVTRAKLVPSGQREPLLGLLAFAAAGGVAFRLAHPVLSTRIPFFRGRSVFAFMQAATAAKKWEDILPPSAHPLMVPLGGLLLPPKAMTSHTLLVGAPESGKSLTARLMMQRALPLVGLGLGHRALIYAAKREDLPLLAGMNLSAPVHILHPWDLRCSAWDIAEITSEAVAREVATALIPEEQGQNRYFTDAARELLTGVMVAFIRTAPDVWDLRDVVWVLRLEPRLRELLGKSAETRHLLDLHTEPRGTFQNIRSTLSTRIDLYAPLAACWHRAATKVRFRDWVDGESIIILGNDPTKRASIHPMNRVMLKWATQLLLSKPNTETERSSVWLDELPDLGKLEFLLELLGEGRTKGVAAVLGTQSIDALKFHYGKDLAEAILATISQLGLLRSAGASTAQWQADRLGDYEFEETNTTVTRRPGERPTVAHARHIVNRKSVLPSQFLSLAATNPTNGLDGFYLSSFIGAWRCHLPGSHLTKELVAADPSVPDYITRPEDHEVLLPWTTEDLLRLGLDPNPSPGPLVITPQGKKSPKLPPSRAVKR